ncbi:MAG: HisA/HisF-related TIM barrel protein [Sedimenticola sp.]|nr:HisA/HisF-related TIM barrel protein [Sedimenticola sp.]
MNIIPVIDLLDGQSVHAKLGRRTEYRPLNSPLCQQGEVLPLIQRLCDDFGMQQLYIADLNAIQGKGDNHLTLHRIAHSFPDLTLWIDAGFATPDAIQTLQSSVTCRPVIGSESWQYTKPFANDQAILSVDSVDGVLRDLSGITTDTRRRPNTLILMNLARVGSQRGPDIDLLSLWSKTAPGAELYMAGGVRHCDDLLTLQAAGASGVLLASAIHSGALTATDLTAFS